MRAFQGQASDNMVIRRTIAQKELLVRELEETLASTKVKSMREQLSTRVRGLREEIRADRRDEAEKAQVAATRAALRQMEAERRPRRQSALAVAKATIGGNVPQP